MADLDPDAEHESATAVLEAILESTVDPALERVRRDHVGDPAFPRPRDLVATIGATEGVIALEVTVPRLDHVVIRDADHADRALDTAYQIGFRNAEARTAPIDYQGVTVAVREYGADVRLEREARPLFDMAEPLDLEDPSDIWNELLDH